jgi:hypothetical protein
VALDNKSQTKLISITIVLIFSVNTSSPYFLLLGQTTPHPGHTSAIKHTKEGRIYLEAVQVT